MTTEPRLESATPVLKSGDYARSRAFYEGTLGFRVVEEGGDPPRFGIFKRGTSVLFVNSWKEPPNPVPGVWEAYIHVTGMDALFAELQAAGAPIVRPVEDTVYGMREFEVADPDGNVVCFGQDSDTLETS